MASADTEDGGVDRSVAVKRERLRTKTPRCPDSRIARLVGAQLKSNFPRSCIPTNERGGAPRDKPFDKFKSVSITPICNKISRLLPRPYLRYVFAVIQIRSLVADLVTRVG